MKVLLIHLVVLSGLSFAAWETEWVYNEGYQFETSIALDSNDYPHVIFSTGYPVATICYAFNNGSIWQVDTVGTSFYNASDLSLESSDIPHVSIPGEDGPGIRHAYQYQGNWVFDDVDSVGAECSIVLDGLDNPHICYTDADQDELKYAHWNGSEWQIEVIDSSTYIGYYLSLALDSNENPHICYHKGSPDSLMYASWNGSIWQIQYLGSFDGPVYFCEIAVDSNSNPHIVFDVAHYLAHSHLWYAHHNGSSWSTIMVDSLVDVSYCDIVVDSDNHPCICYCDAYTYSLFYAHYNGSIWTKEDVDDSYWGSSMDIGSDGCIHISYCYGDGVKHAWQLETGIDDDITLQPSVVLYSPAPNPFSSSLTISFNMSTTSGATLEVFDLTGGLVESLVNGSMVSGEHSVVFDGNELSNGMYLIRLTTETATCTESCVLIR